MTRTRVVILVKDGVVQNAVADSPVEILLLDERASGSLSGQNVTVSNSSPEGVDKIIAAVESKTLVVRSE